VTVICVGLLRLRTQREAGCVRPPSRFPGPKGSEYLLGMARRVDSVPRPPAPRSDVYLRWERSDRLELVLPGLVPGVVHLRYRGQTG